ncbi:MAG: SAM-dependent methyltransferase [Acidobacteria bacterium]|nr:SAM-dependent methyltransferase [Acidobacteriota bacterium]
MPFYLSLLLLSAATLAYELALMRAFSIALWHHFAYMVISIALLGFGASGTFLSLWWRRPHDASRPRNPEKAFAVLTILFALSLPSCFAVAQRIPLDPFLLLWDARQWLWLVAFYLLFFVPFFLAATAIGLLLIERAPEAPRVYFFNLLGSGLGSLLLVIFLYLVPPERVVLLIYIIALTAALLVVRVFRAETQLLVLGLLVGGFYAFHFSDALAIRLSQYKSLSINLNLPAAEIVAERYSPLGRVDVLRSPAFRHAPGLSLAAQATPPEQLGLFVDGEAAGALNRFDGQKAPLAFLDWATNAAPYSLGRLPGHVLVLGAGGGSDVLLALYHDSAHIDAVELNPQIIALVRDRYGEFTGGIYARPDVRLHAREARGFLESLPPGEQFDLIQISLLDSLAAATAGVHALNESYLYTVEAFGRYFEHLSPGGVLAITRWLKMPPRDTPKLFATAVAALEEHGVARPGEHLALVRSWATATLLLKHTPFTPEEIAALKQFAEERLFDLDYYPGITPEETNRFNRLARSYYYEAAVEILAGGERRQAFFRDYPFHLRPARDDRPYFDHFFRWRALPLLLRTYGRQWLPFLEWGYLILVATLVQVAVISFALILLPLLLARRGQADVPPESRRGSRAHIFLFFLAIGLGFLFIEIVLIQKFTFFLANPIYAIAVVLAGVLMWSGLGSLSLLLVRRSPRLPRVCTAIAALSLAATFLLPVLLPALIGLPTAARVAISLALMMPLAFLMGMPFPLAWQRVEASRAKWLAWAWGINGCASVVAAVLATLLAISFGFRFVFLCAAALYLLAALAAPRLASSLDRNSSRA